VVFRSSQTQSLLPSKAFAFLHYPFTRFIKTLCRHRCPGRSAREQRLYKAANGSRFETRPLLQVSPE